MPAPVFGEGTDLAVNDGANSAFVDLEDVVEITPPAETQVVVPDRNLLSNTTHVEPAFSTRRDLGQFSFTYENKYALYDRIEDLRDDASDPSWRLTAADGNLRLAFTGRVISNAPQSITGGVITTAMATIQLTSVVTVSDATP